MSLKKIIKKVGAIAASLTMIAGIISTTMTVSAVAGVPDCGNLYIHAYSVPDTKYAGTPNDGTEKEVPENAVMLSDIEYKIYEVNTGGYYPQSGPCKVNSMTEPTYVTDDEGGTFSVTPVKTARTGKDGIASALGLKKGIYVVVEQKSDKTARLSAPYFVAVPMTNAAGDGWTTDVHTYPKSNDILITKEVDRTSVHIGEVVTWTLMPTAGSVAEDCLKYEVTDQLDKALDFVEGSVKTYGVLDSKKSLIPADNYTVKINTDNLLTISFTEKGRKLLPGYDSLKIDFQTKTNKEILKRINYTVYNQSSVILDNKYDQETKRDSNIVKIHTAIINVFKTNPSKNPLSGAVFSVASSEENAKSGKYLRIDESGNIIDYSEEGYDSAKVWSVVTGRDGYASFEGLKDYDMEGNYLTYYLVETRAPKGYSILGSPVNAKFTADNSKEATTYTIHISIKNDSIPKLPLTGSKGAWLYVSLAVAVVIVGLAVYKKKNIHL